MLFYVLSIFLLVCIVPWTQVPPSESPFIGALDRIGIPGSADLMNAIIVTAVLSCLNSGLYTGSRMLSPWHGAGTPPRACSKSTHAGYVKAILATTAIGFLSTILAWLSPETVFLFLVNSSGAIALFVYLLIAVAQLRAPPARARRPREAQSEDVALPLAHLVLDRGHRGRDRLDGRGGRRGHALLPDPELHLTGHCGGGGVHARPARARAGDHP